MIPKEINLNTYKFQNDYYITGHFDFEINVEYENNPSKTINRRYSDIRNLYKTLILKSPGCLIPNIPNKSLWLKINYANKEQMIDRMEGIKEFLNHLINHKILRKNKYVISFFSSNYKRTSSNSSKNDKNDSDDDFNIRESSNSYKNKNDYIKNSDDNDDSDKDFEPLKDFIEEYINKKKGIVSKGKELFGNMLNYVMSYASSNKKEENEENNNNNNNEENNNISNTFYKKLSKEDYEYIKKKMKELGEDFEINEYNEKINRLNEGIKNIIQNFKKLSTIREKNIHCLENIINNDNYYRNNKKDKIDKINININNNVDRYDDGDTEPEKSSEDNKINNHKDNISKIRQHCVIQRGFLNKIEQSLTKIKKYQKLLEGLLDIYSRKKEHLNFLGRLHSQKAELEKQKNEKDLIDPIIKNKIDEIESKLEYEIKFIKKINKDLKYEIEKYKDNQEDIYIFINSLYKDKSISIKNCLENLNKSNINDFEDNVE